MKPLLELRGIITVLNTPFAADGRIDLEAVRRNVRLCLQQGVAGFLVPAMAAEVGKLSLAEKIAMVRHVVDEVQGRVPVIGGASAPSAAERIEAARTYIELGCPGVLVSLIYENEAQYERSVYEIAELGPSFLMLQDWSTDGFGVPVPLIARLFREVEPFRSYKIEVVPAGVKYSQVIEATEGRLHVAGGWAVTQMIEALDRGVHAFMPTAMNDIYVAIYRLYAQGNRPAARELFQRLLPVLAFSNQHLDMSIHFFKRLLHRQGIYATDTVREPSLVFDHHHRRIADELIDVVGELSIVCDKRLAEGQNSYEMPL